MATNVSSYDGFDLDFFSLFNFYFTLFSSIVEYIESSREEKVNSLVYDSVYHLLFIFLIIIIHIVFLLFMIEEHKITDRNYILIMSDCKLYNCFE